MSYEPRPAPRRPEDLSVWLEQEMRDIASAFRVASESLLTPLTSFGERYPYNSGTETILTLGARDSYLMYSQPRQYGDNDYRHGILALVGRANARGTGTAGTEGYVNIAEIVRLPGSADAEFQANGYDVLYYGGGGVPYTSIYYWRLS